MITFNIDKNNFDNISYISSDDTVTKLYNEYGDSFHNHIDGQFLFIVRDGYHLDFFTDPWGTHQVNYLNKNGNFCFTNFIPKWEILHPEIFIPINSHSRFDTRNKTLEIINPRLHSWKFDNKKNDSMDIVEENFNNVVIEKWEPNSTFFLSSGVDSNAIAVCLSDNKKKFNALCVMYNPEFESETVLDSVIEYCGEYINYERIDKTTTDHGHKGSVLSEIYHRTKNVFKSDLVLTGFGSDDDIDDDCWIISSGSKFQAGGIITDVPEWNKPTYGPTSILLNHQEKYALNFEVDLRHVYYSKKLIQSWNDLDDKFKLMKKPFCRKYVSDRNLPFTQNTKNGIGHQASSRYSYNDHRRMTRLINNLNGE